MTISERNKAYLVVGSHPWNQLVFEEVIANFPGEWSYLGSPEELNIEAVRRINPRYIFFLHWSWKVPDQIIDEFECVCFHMTDVPFGRGGSPLQNLIIRGYKDTKLTALQMTNEFDAGPIYIKELLSLDGNAEQIYIRATYMAAEMINRIIETTPEPFPQEGEVVVFKRRKPQESEIPRLESLVSLYDFVRMLDAEGYPRAFLEYKSFRFEFSKASCCEDRIVAEVTITKVNENGS